MITLPANLDLMLLTQLGGLLLRYTLGGCQIKTDCGPKHDQGSVVSKLKLAVSSLSFPVLQQDHQVSSQK